MIGDNENNLVVVIPDEYSNVFSLYAEGRLIAKKYLKDYNVTQIEYKAGSIVFLYYTMPRQRMIVCARVPLPPPARNGTLKKMMNCSIPLKQMFSFKASRVDKTRRVIGFLNSHFKNAYCWPDAFYKELAIRIALKGDINFQELDRLSDRFAALHNITRKKNFAYSGRWKNT